MKTLAIASVLVASILANALTAQAAPSLEKLDGYKLFDDIAGRSSQ